MLEEEEVAWFECDRERAQMEQQLDLEKALWGYKIELQRRKAVSGLSDQGKAQNWQVSEAERWKKATIGWEKKMDAGTWESNKGTGKRK